MTTITTIGGGQFTLLLFSAVFVPILPIKIFGALALRVRSLLV